MYDWELGKNIRLRFLHLKRFYKSHTYRFDFCRVNNCGYKEFRKYQKIIDIMLQRMDVLTNWVESVCFYGQERNLIKYEGIDGLGNILSEEEKLEYLLDKNRNDCLISSENKKIIDYINNHLRSQEIMAKIYGYEVIVSEKEIETISREDFKGLISKCSLSNPIKDASPILYEKKVREHREMDDKISYKMCV